MKYDPAKHRRRSIRLKGYDYSAPGAYFITICTHQRQCLFGEIIAGQMELNTTGLWVQACWQQLPHRFSRLTLDAFIVMPNHLHGILWLVDENHADNNDAPRRGEAFDHKLSIPSKQSRSNASPLPTQHISPIQHDRYNHIIHEGEAFGHQLLEKSEIFRPNASPLPIPKQRGLPIPPKGTKSGSIAAIIQNFKSISTRQINQSQGNAGRTVWQRNYYEHIIRDHAALTNIQNYIRNNPLSWHKDQLHPNS